MKTLDLSAVTPSVGIIPQKDTVEHITASYLEGVASLAKSMIPTSWLTGKLVILHGCVATGTNPGARTLTAGSVFYNGEVYQVPSASFTTTGSQIGIWTLQDVNTGTESKLTDGSDVHVLVDNRFVFAAGLAGGGDFDEDDDVNITYVQDSDYILDGDVIDTPYGTDSNFGNVSVSSCYIRASRRGRMKKIQGTINLTGGVYTDFNVDALFIPLNIKTQFDSIYSNISNASALSVVHAPVGLLTAYDNNGYTATGRVMIFNNKVVLCVIPVNDKISGTSAILFFDCEYL